MWLLKFPRVLCGGRLIIIIILTTKTTVTMPGMCCSVEVTVWMVYPLYRNFKSATRERLFFCLVGQRSEKWFYAGSFLLCVHSGPPLRSHSVRCLCRQKWPSRRTSVRAASQLIQGEINHDSQDLKVHLWMYALGKEWGSTFMKIATKS